MFSVHGFALCILIIGPIQVNSACLTKWYTGDEDDAPPGYKEVLERDLITIYTQPFNPISRTLHAFAFHEHNKNEGAAAICKNMDEPQCHYTIFKTKVSPKLEVVPVGFGPPGAEDRIKYCSTDSEIKQLAEEYVWPSDQQEEGKDQEKKEKEKEKKEKEKEKKGGIRTLVRQISLSKGVRVTLKPRASGIGIPYLKEKSKQKLVNTSDGASGQSSHNG